MSSRHLSNFSVMRTLVKREFQEHRTLFVHFPIALTLFNLVLIIGIIAGSWRQNEPATDFSLMLGHALLPPQLQELRGVEAMQAAQVWDWEHTSRAGAGVQISIRPPELQALQGTQAGPVTVFSVLPDVARSMWLIAPSGSAGPWFMSLFWGVMLYYFLMTLYKQRQDRSILFWNSMPVSAAQTILSKWLAGMIGCQAIFLGCLLVLHLFLLISWRLYVSFHGLEGSLTAWGWPVSIQSWMTGAVSSEIVRSYVTLVGISLISLAWTLPVYAWLLLASAWSRSLPFAWAAGPWVLIMGIEFYFTQKYQIATTLLKHAMPTMATVRYRYYFMDKLGELLTPDLAVSAVLGLALIYAAIRLNRSEDV